MKTPAEILANQPYMTNSQKPADASNRSTEAEIKRKMMDVSSRENFSPADMQDMVMFWSRMQDIYGAKWSGQYGADPVGENDQLTESGSIWCRQYKKLSADQFKMALLRIADRIKHEQHDKKESWPPAPMEFYSMAVDTTAVDWEHKRQSQPYFVDDVARPALPDNSVKKTPAEHIAEMKSLLGMK